MKNPPRKKPDPKPMRPEYDFSGGVRGKYYERYKQGVVAVMLEPDVAEVFKSSASVNEALRALVNVARAQVPPK
jgi:hypothetical protein